MLAFDEPRREETLALIGYSESDRCKATIDACLIIQPCTQLFQLYNHLSTSHLYPYYMYWTT